MAKKEKEPIIKEIKASPFPLSPIFANVIGVNSHEDIVVLNFGFVSGSYCEPHEFEDKQVACICLPWDSIEDLSNTLIEALSDYKKPPSKSTIKTKK